MKWINIALGTSDLKPDTILEMIPFLAVQAPVQKVEALFTSPPKRTPSDAVPDGPLLGNGDLGVVLGGTPESLVFHISKNDFWRAVAHYSDGSPKPIGTLRISSDNLKGASYRVRQRLWEADLLGEFATQSKTLKVHAWTPATDNSLIVDLSNDGTPIDLDLSLDAADGIGSTTSKTDHSVTRSFTQGVEWPCEATMAITLDHRPTRTTHFKIHLEAGKSQSIILSVRTNHDSPHFQDDAIAAAQSLSVTKLAKDHERWWQSFWKKSEIQIDDPLIERYWYGSQYLMAMCSRNTAYAPGLFGNWISTDHPSWAGDYHLNYNYLAPWWGVYSSNHVELSQPYDAPLLAAIPRGRENATKLLGMPGVYLEVGIGPRGLLTCKSPDYDLFWGQKSDAIYATVDMLMRWRATRDSEYLRKTAYPFLREVADFWTHYLVDENGRYVIKNDAIHEGSGNDTNPILTLGLLRNLLTGMVDASKALRVDEKGRLAWQNILDKLSEYPTQVRNGKTVFRYTEKGMAWNDGNSLGIQHIYPSGAIGLGSEPKLLQISRDMISEMGRWSDYNAFPTFYTAAVRVGYDSETILTHLREQLTKHGYQNLFVYYGGGGIECCSAVPTCINEMLLQSHEGIIRLFPVWPKHKDASFKTLRADGAFLVSASLKNGAIRDVTVTSEKGGTCKVQLPWSESATIRQTGGRSQPSLKATVVDGILSFPTRPKATYRIMR